MSPLPLAGERVVVTRSAHQAGGLVAALAAAGADVVRLPLIELRPPPDPGELTRVADRIDDFDWLVFTSANAVRAFMPRLRPPLDLRTAVVGPATAEALRRSGIEPNVEAKKTRATGLVEVLLPTLTPNTRILIPQAEDARTDLVRGLRSAGARVTPVTAYAKGLPAGTAAFAEEIFSRSSIGWVTCTSPRIARHFADLFGDEWHRRRTEMRAVSIGPVTSSELRRLGVGQIAEAVLASDEGLVEAIVSGLTRRRARS